MRKPVFGVSDQVRHINRARGLKFQTKEIKGSYTIYVAKTKALISCTVTVQLICGFVFAYAKKVGFLVTYWQNRNHG